MLILDRLAGDMAIIEYADGTFQVPRSLLPAEVKPGDVLRFIIEVDAEATDKRRAKMERLLNSLWEDEPTPET